MLAAGLVAATAASRTGAAGVTFERLYELKPAEGVFAYARISPSGQLLAYASELRDPSNDRVVQAETVIDLLFIQPHIGPNATVAPPAPITVVVNWMAGIKK